MTPRDVTREFRRRVEARNGKAPSDWYERFEVELAGECDDYDRHDFDASGCDTRCVTPARVLGWAILGCLAIVASAFLWAWIFN